MTSKWLAEEHAACHQRCEERGCVSYPQLERERDDLRAENERLRAALEHVVEVFAGFERMGAGGPAIKQAREALRK